MGVNYEDQFLEKLFPLLPMRSEVIVPPGDDCAVICIPGHDRYLLMAVDQVIAGTHYLESESTPFSIGYKLLARNLSDIAAMGGNPLYALVAASIPPVTPLQRLYAVMEGIRLLAQQYQMAIIGGDLARNSNETWSLTIIGEVEPECLCTRRGARVGDKIYVTGELGNSYQSGHHLQFTPRVREGRWLATQKMVHSMIDVTDGLVKDLTRICRQSSCAAQLNTQILPLRSGASREMALGDGEDYELLFTLSSSDAEWLESNWPFSTRLSLIGEVISGDPGQVYDERENLLNEVFLGYQHF